MTLIELRCKYKQKLDISTERLLLGHNDYVSAFQMAYQEILKDLYELGEAK